VHVYFEYVCFMFASCLLHRVNGVSLASGSLRCVAVIGCATPAPPDDGWVERGTSETVIVGCNFTRQRWYLHCAGRRWVGDARNCSAAVHNIGLFTRRVVCRIICVKVV